MIKIALIAGGAAALIVAALVAWIATDKELEKAAHDNSINVR